ncbi:MAG: FKBP-type peptidyl-prolyl cis-trans isomerase [Longimicrobiales bacterium]
MAEARSGDTVRVHYTGKLDDGSVFDSSRERGPLEFQLGAGQVITGFDSAVAGMEPGQDKEVRIPADEAYGPRREELKVTVDRSQLPQGLDPEVGQQLQMKQGEETMVVRIAEIEAGRVTLDANHPLAGKDLTFELELVEIV